MRLFTGIALPPLVRDNLARVLAELRPLAPLNWSPLENLHITAKFIGEWPDDRVGELERVLEKFNPPVAFEVEIAGFGYLADPRHPRTLFAGVHAGPALAALASTIDLALAPIGVPRESRRYSPHLTLARIKHEDIRPLREHIANMTNVHFGKFPVSEFHLYLGRRSAYTPLATYPLLTAASIEA